jgi:ribosomal protein L6P/L9E
MCGLAALLREGCPPHPFDKKGILWFFRKNEFVSEKEMQKLVCRDQNKGT